MEYLDYFFGHIYWLIAGFLLRALLEPRLRKERIALRRWNRLMDRAVEHPVPEKAEARPK